MGNRLNWANRQGPGEFDVSAPTVKSFAFDYHRSTAPNTDSWPKGFGPSVISKAWKHGLIVVAEIEGFPYPVAVTKSHWAANGVLEIDTLEGPRVPERIWTRPSAKGLTASGLLIIDEGD